MATYEYGRIAKLDERLRKAQIAPEILEQIMAGGERINRKTSGKAIADWMCHAMERMDQLLAPEIRQQIREGCACCLGGKRLEMVKSIAKRGGTLAERVQAANEAKLVFGNGVTLLESGELLVRFAPDESVNNRCVCLPHASQPISETYCMCCGGHIKHHLQIAVGQPLVMRVRTSALSSGGEHPCSFLFTLAN